MRFMIVVKADKNSEAGVLPTDKLLTEGDFGPAFTPEHRKQEERQRMPSEQLMKGAKR
jgi:hypothetical protein